MANHGERFERSEATEVAAARGRLGLLFAAGLVAIGTASCRQILGIDDRTESGSTGGGGSATTSSTAVTSSTGSTGGAPGSCTLDLIPKKPTPGCQSCLLKQCCAELATCETNPGCAGCVAQTSACDKFDVTVNQQLEALKSCAHEACGDICYPAAGTTQPTCDDEKTPTKACVTLSAVVTCIPYYSHDLFCPGGNKDSCDVTQDNFNAATGLTCAHGPNPNHTCEACGVIEGYCHTGLTCVNGKCGRWCCSDEDCPSGHCDTGWTTIKFGGHPPPEIAGLGVCAKAP